MQKSFDQEQYLDLLELFMKIVSLVFLFSHPPFRFFLVMAAKCTRQKQERETGGLFQKCGEVCRWSTGGRCEGESCECDVTVM